MFILIELGAISLLLWLIANLAHYFYSQVNGEGPDGNGIFCLSNQWLRDKKKKEDPK